MAFILKGTISENEYKSLSDEAVKSIEQSINESMNSSINKTEADNAKKFEGLIEDITDKYETQVNAVVLESAKANTGAHINKKLYSIVKDITNLLEGAGITTTEKTKELRQKLKKADENLENSYSEREVIKDQLNDETKKNLIYTKLRGMEPEIIDLALQTFANKDIREIDDEAIEVFLDGDFTELVADSVEDDQFSGDIEFDQIHDALANIDETKKDTPIKDNKVFESLGKGLKQQTTVMGTPNVTRSQLDNMSQTLTEGGNINSDANEVMGKIGEMQDFGYPFQ